MTGLTQIGLKSSIFQPVWIKIWWLTSKNNGVPLLYYIKLSASFEIHRWIQLGVTVRKTLNSGQNRRPSSSMNGSVHPSVCPSYLFDCVPIIVSSWNFQELLPMTELTSMQKVKVRAQRSRSQRSTTNLAVSGLNSRMMMKWCTELDVA